MIYSAKNALEDTERLFIAVKLPSCVQEEMIRLQKSLIDQSVLIGNYPKPETMHVTLKFIGDVQRNKIPLIQQALRTIKVAPIHVCVANLMFFEHLKVPKVVYVALDSPEMKKLVHTINSTLKEFCMPEEREFKLHITLVRVKEMINHSVFIDWMSNTQIEPMTFVVESFSLMQSKLNSSGPNHTTVEQYPFKP